MIAVTTADIDHWRRQLGRAEIRTQMIDLESMRRFASALGSDPDVERCPPPLAHWAYFLDLPNPAQIGRDGHVVSDRAILPPTRGWRRMFAGSVVEFYKPLSIGIAAELTLSLAGIKHRVSHDGDRVFFDIDRRLSQNQAIRIVERQTIVYRADALVTAPVEPRSLGDSIHGAIWSPSVVDLFRFSAATFNAHRIHYDAAYAREEEGYPDLVVQGPLTAAKLFEVARQDGREISQFTFRAKAPLFVGQPVRLVRGDGLDEWQAVRCDGVIAMSARAA